MARQSILRIYDEACKGLMISKIKIPDPTGDPATHYHVATNDRPYGFELPVDSKGNIDTRRADLMLETPQVTLVRNTVGAYDMSRNNTNVFRKVRWWDSDKKFWVQSAHPRPWNIPYTFEIVSRTRWKGQLCIEPFLFGVQPVRVLYIDFSYPWGKKYISAIFSEINDNSELEVGEALRYFRYSIPFTLECFMFEPLEHPHDVPTLAEDPEAFTVKLRSVHSVGYQFRDMNDQPFGEPDLTVDLTSPPPDFSNAPLVKP